MSKTLGQAVALFGNRPTPGPHPRCMIVAGGCCSIQLAESSDHPFRGTRMRNLMLFVMRLAVVVVVIGFKQGWFELTTSHNAGSSSVDMYLKVDADKAKADANEMSHIK